MRIRVQVILALIFLTAASALADEQIAPDIASRIAKDFREALPPGYEVTIIDPLTIAIGPHGRPPSRVNLDNINRVCLGDPDQCEVRLSDFASKIVEFIKDQDTPPSKTQLRAVVRPKDYVDEITREMKGQEPVAGAITGDLVELCYFDMPTTMRIATAADLKSFGLTSDDALALCKRNMESAFPSLQSQIKIPADGSIGILTGDRYQSSRFLFHDDWSPVAAQFGGHLIIAVPAADIVLYGRDTDAASVDAMADMARRMSQDAQRPVSTKVFRWTPTGWDIAAP